MNINNLEIKYIDNNLLGKRFGKLTIIEPNKYYDISDKYNAHYVKCRCDCGVIKYINLRSMINLRIKSCGHCYDNKYQIIDDYVSILHIYNSFNCCWEPILINTECVDYLKSFGTWGISINALNRCDIRITTKYRHISLSRTIVSYINSKYNLPPLTDDLAVDHISGNTFNNLYYPFNDYYNNLRVCTYRQNNLNRYCDGYVYVYHHNKQRPYQSFIKTENKLKSKYFKSPQECINYNISQLSDIDKQYYYHSPSNPRNNPNTFSNTILNAIGYNDNEYD